MAAKRPILWRPNPGRQSEFLASPAYEVAYGGAAGGGKSAALLVAPLRWVSHPTFSALLVRRTFKELERSLIGRAFQFYPAAGGRHEDSGKRWRFPSGATIEFGHIEHEQDVHSYQSAEYQFIGFDELTSFTEHQYVYMLSRARSAHGVPIRIRSATNPGGVGHEWVLKRWAPWLDRSSEYDGLRVEPGKVLYYRNSADGPNWCEKGDTGALSRQFIPARVTDNPHLMDNDPGYVDRLMGLDRVSREQLLEGNWLARPAAGAYFKRGYFEIVSAAPSNAERVRHWDRAATEAKQGSDPDWTVGLKLAKKDGTYYVEDVTRFRESPGKVEKSILATAELDGDGCMVHLAQDPGSAGKFEVAYYKRALAGFNVRSDPETGDKVTRAQPASAQAEAGNIKIVRAPWNDSLIQELEQFPEGAHDDQVDSLSGAFAVLHRPEIARGVGAVPMFA